MSHKIIFENWRKFVKLNEQGVDEFGNPLTIGSARELAAEKERQAGSDDSDLPNYGTVDVSNMDSFGGQKPKSAKEAGMRVMKGMGFDCSDEGQFKLIDSYGVFRESVIEPFFDSKAVSGDTLGHLTLGAVGELGGDGSTTGPVDVFLGAVEMAFSACADEDGERTGADYHGFTPVTSAEERENNWQSYSPDQSPGNTIPKYFKQQNTWEGVGRAFTIAVNMAQKNGHSPFMNKDGSVYSGATGG